MFNKNAQNAAINATPESKPTLNITGATIQAAHMVSDNIAVFTLNIPGATFMNMKVIDGKNGMFIAMPQQKGKNDQWYDEYRLYLSDEDTARIIKAVGEHCAAVGAKCDYKTRYEV